MHKHQHKPCPACGDTKPLDAFVANGQSHRLCIECHAVRRLKSAVNTPTQNDFDTHVGNHYQCVTCKEWRTFERFTSSPHNRLVCNSCTGQANIQPRPVVEPLSRPGRAHA